MMSLSTAVRLINFTFLMSVTTLVLAEHPASFVDSATAKGIAEIEISKLALEKSSSDEIKIFARSILSDFSASNKQLSVIAKKRNIPVLEDEELGNQMKAFSLKHRDKESFDAAYINNQIKALQSVIELFEAESVSPEPNNEEFKGFASRMLPKLKDHLDTAQRIAPSINDATDRGAE